MFLEVARILQETESASDLLSDKAGLIMHNLARCAQLGGDQNKSSTAVIDRSPDLTKVLTILRFYLLILTTYSVLHLASCSNHLQPGDIRPVHVTTSISQCNQIGVASPGHQENRAVGVAYDSQQSHCTRRRRRHSSPIWESRAAGFIVERSDHAAKDVSPACCLSSASPSKYGSRGVCTADALVRVITNTGMPASSHSTHVPHGPKDLPSYARTEEYAVRRRGRYF